MSQEQLELRAQTHPNIPSKWFNRFNLAFSTCQYRMRPIERPWADLSYPPLFRTRPASMPRLYHSGESQCSETHPNKRSPLVKLTKRCSNSRNWLTKRRLRPMPPNWNHFV